MAVARRMVGFVAATALVGCGAWMVASVAPSSTFGVQMEGLTGAPAAYGLAFEANIFAGICAVWLVVDVLYVSRERISNALVIRGLLGSGVLVSLTRAAALGAIVGMVVGAMSTRRTRRVASSALFVAGLAVGAVFLIGPTVPLLRPIAEKGSQLVDLDSSTSIVRRVSWDLAIEDLSGEELLLGRGVNTFGQYHEDPSRPTENVPGYLSNVFLQVVYDVGIIGTTLLVAGAAVLLRRLPRRDARLLGVIACAAIVGAATSPIWFANWWVLVGLAASAGQKVEPALELEDSRVTRQSHGAPIGSVGLR
jgi:O-antigen ligase